jgi:hypothetical protein
MVVVSRRSSIGVSAAGGAEQEKVMVGTGLGGNQGWRADSTSSTGRGGGHLYNRIKRMP